MAKVEVERSIPRGLDGFEYLVFRFERWICVLSLFVMLLTVSLSVAIRYFNLGLPNVAEWAVVAMSPLTFIGAAMCTYAQAHIAVDVVKLLPQASIRRAARGVVALCLLAFAGVYSWIGVVFFMDMRASGERMLDMGTPVYVPVFFLMLGTLLMLLHAAIELWRVLSKQSPVSEESLR